MPEEQLREALEEALDRLDQIGRAYSEVWCGDIEPSAAWSRVEHALRGPAPEGELVVPRLRAALAAVPSDRRLSEQGRCAEQTEGIGGVPLGCTLRHGHGGMHHDESGCDWTANHDPGAIADEVAKLAGSDCPCRQCCVTALTAVHGHALFLPMVVCRTCGNKRCPHAEHHDNPCTGSNEPGQPGSGYPFAPSPARRLSEESKQRVARQHSEAPYRRSAPPGPRPEQPTEEERDG